MTPEILLKISDILNFSNANDLVCWCIFLFGFFLLARKSNLVPTTRKYLSERKFLSRQGVLDKGDFLIVKFRWTKIIQKGEIILEIPLVQTSDSVLCPVKAYRLMCKAGPATADSPSLMLRDNKVDYYRYFQAKLKLCI